MISGCAYCGCIGEAIGLFDEMLKARVEPNEATYVSALHACAVLGALGLGKSVHRYMIDKNVKMCLFLENSLVDMYAQCGDLDMATRIFNAMAHRDVITWNAIMCGITMHGMVQTPSNVSLLGQKEIFACMPLLSSDFFSAVAM
ncbi:hypothetical protein AMTRI_Chr03g145430 [Amborella trichopoda]